MKNFKSYLIAALTVAVTSGSVFADRCSVNISLRERFNNPTGHGYAVANLGQLLTEAERIGGVRLDDAQITGLSLEVSADNGLIMAWKDVSGRNQNSGAAISVRSGRGSYRIDDAHWRNMVISDRQGVRPDHIDVNATGSGVVTGATLSFQAPTRICDSFSRGSTRRDDRGYDDRGYDDRGNDDRGYDDRGNDDHRHDDRGYDDRGNGGRGNGGRVNDGRGNGRRVNRRGGF
ncbi:MAG TPA: hypothetical protein VNJ01_12020 [Bacteriovoracaceae bacterium]|nr:hypothetical protein [Bacteriovoracaceae bacterium]